jgi:hypothetical protein
MSSDLTVSQLERLLERKRARLEKLQHRRDQLLRQLARVDAQIASIGGARPLERTGRPKRKRPRNSMTLLQAVVDVLGQNKKGITLKQLAAKILEKGYKTASANFENTIYQIIYNNRDKVVHDGKTKTYRLK